MADEKKLYDVIVVGGGPAGLTVAIYLARARYRVLVLEKEQFGGQITISHEVVNYPGIGKTSGKALTETMQKQAEAFGAEFLLTEATSLDLDGDIKTVHTDRATFNASASCWPPVHIPARWASRAKWSTRAAAWPTARPATASFSPATRSLWSAAAEESVFPTKFARHVTIPMITDDFTCAEAVAEPARDMRRSPCGPIPSWRRSPGKTA